MNPADLSIPEAAAAFRAGTLTARALTEATLTRIAERNPHLHAFTHLNPQALQDADHADALLATGPPIPPLRHPHRRQRLDRRRGPPRHLRFRRPFRPHRVVRCEGRRPPPRPGRHNHRQTRHLRIRHGRPRPAPARSAARNPWNTKHITGGSSSGSAAAVAGGLIRLALGTDTGGSIRAPAAYCGCVGLKPTYDRVSRHGAFPLSPSLDHTGPLAATVEEAAIALDAITQTPENWRPASGKLTQGAQGLNIAYARDWFALDPQASPALIQAMDAAAAQLSLLGAQITLIQLPDYALYEAAGSIILHAEALSEHETLIKSKSALYGRPTLQCLAFGAAISPEDLAAARQAQTRLTAQLHAATQSFDLLITPTTLTPALPFAAFDGEKAVWTPMRTIPFNVTGQPALSLPIGFDQNLPLGMQIAGKPGDEDLICAAAHAFERATDHSAQRPK